MNDQPKSQLAFQWPVGKLSQVLLIVAAILFVLYSFFLFSHLFLDINPPTPSSSESFSFNFQLVEAIVGIMFIGFLMLAIVISLRRSGSIIRKIWLKVPFTSGAVILMLFASFASWCFNLVAVLTGGKGLPIRTVSLVLYWIAFAILIWGLLHGENLNAKNNSSTEANKQ